MRMMRCGAVMIVGVITSLCLLGRSGGAQQQDAYPQTLHWGSGLINVPSAWVSPRHADVRLLASGKNIPWWYEPGEMTFATRLNTNIAIETHWLNRFTIGLSAYSQNPQWGFFGSVLVIRENQFEQSPALAIGFRNLGPGKHEDRYLVGHDIRLDPDRQEYVEAIAHEGFSTAPTLFAVLSKDFPVGAIGAAGLPAVIGASLGWGNGLFSDDGGLGDEYNAHGTIASGLFLGARFAARPTENTIVHVLAENDAWDWNLGIVGDWRGISLGFYVSELEEGGRPDGVAQVYNYRKWNVSLGYTGNIIDISRGSILRTRITELMREQTRLRAEIAQRDQRIRGLEAALLRAQAGELADIERRRQELEAQVREEREAIRRAMERLEQIQQGREPITPTSFNPPTSP